MDKNNFMKIIVYDSGIGGRVVFDFLKEKLDPDFHQDDSGVRHPELDSPLSSGQAGSIQIEYFSDEMNFPYGTKTEEELQRIVLENLSKFKTIGYDQIVVACNTASSIIDAILDKNTHAKAGNVHTIIKPTVEYISDLSSMTNLYVIGSQYTIENQIYSRSLHSMKVQYPIHEVAEQGLIHAIEHGEKVIISRIIKRIIGEVAEGSYLLLGCTHFSVVKNEFEKESIKQKKKIEIIDPSEILVMKVEL